MRSMKDLLGDTPYKAPTFDAKASVAARDSGIKKVKKANSGWVASVIEFIRALPPGWTGSAEDIRRGWIGPPPSHPNAWGAVSKTAVGRKLIACTGRRVKMTAVSSHARLTDEYVRTETR